MIGAAHAACLALHRNFFAIVSKQKDILRLFRQLFKRDIQRKTVVFSQSLIIHLCDTTFGVIPAAGFYRPFTNRKIFIGYHKIRVYLHKSTQTGTFFTGAKRTVKGKHARRKIFD
ncbi:hypothetical protein SDC9_181622 [bioreactor metagenome]|uniref:Uncharacterized protein n=1 Tax=bioreactor metagenome TaxID=1076179 RepID=A0A645H7R1_9ZZZZ